MANFDAKSAILDLLKAQDTPVSLPQLQALSTQPIPERSLRRWLAGWVEQGILERTGRKRGTRYRWLPHPTSFAFMEGLNNSQRKALTAQLRDLWTHTSTALEGNRLTLGDTHFVLEEGLTISGKPLKDHEEVTGHARAIDLIYRSLYSPFSEALLFELHKAVQTDLVIDILKPNGAWKVEPNGTYVVEGGRQIYLEYAAPGSVRSLMKALIGTLNNFERKEIDEAPNTYAQIHMAIAHIHPFWDGNGRIARLVANVPLLKSGLPPIVIPTDQRRRYIEVLARYQIATGQLTATSGVWPNHELLNEFSQFCRECYAATMDLLASIRN